MEYVIHKRDGSTVEFSTDLNPDQAADVLRPHSGSSEFVSSLVDAHRRDRLSRPMELWLLKLAQDRLEESTGSQGPFAGLLEAINRMQAQAKARVILRCVGVTIKACTQGANEGGSYLFSPSGTYRGKLTPRGTLQGPSDLAEVLAPISADPVAAALAYGQETGECACCGRELSDPVSVYGGIGPICLERLAGRDARKQLEAQFKASQAGSLQLVVA